MFVPYISNIIIVLFSMGFAKANENKTAVSNPNITTFSGPISPYPVKKIYVHGRPVYVRQMFLSPIKKTDIQSSQDDIFVERRSQLAAPSFRTDSNSIISPQSPIYAPASQPNIGKGAGISRFDEETYESKKPKYPLPSCYTNDSGFMCCNKELENIMDDAFDDLKNRKGSDWQSCNVQQIANVIQKAVESHFNMTFEVVAGVGDYASKSHFFHNYICKKERDNRFLLAYATPKPEGVLANPPYPTSIGGPSLQTKNIYTKQTIII